VGGLPPGLFAAKLTEAQSEVPENASLSSVANAGAYCAILQKIFRINANASVFAAAVHRGTPEPWA
jgi:hypothetical protein